jgi:hypothetical protein
MKDHEVENPGFHWEEELYFYVEADHDTIGNEINDRTYKTPGA